MLRGGGNLRSERVSYAVASERPNLVLGLTPGAKNGDSEQLSLPS